MGDDNRIYDLEREIERVKSKQENDQQDIKEIKDDLKNINEVCNSLREMTSELKISNQNQERILQRLDNGEINNIVTILKLRMEEMERREKERDSESKKYKFYWFSTIMTIIIGAIATLIII